MVWVGTLDFIAFQVFSVVFGYGVEDKILRGFQAGGIIKGIDVDRVGSFKVFYFSDKFFIIVRVSKDELESAEDVFYFKY